MPRILSPGSVYRPQIITLTDIKDSADDVEAPKPDDAAYGYRILAEGDSWFSIGAIPSSNLLFELELPASTLILNLAYPGDTVEKMSSLCRNPDFREMVHDERFGYHWDMLLLSGGGNDLIDRIGNILQKPAAAGSTQPLDYINARELAGFLGDVQAGYRQFVAVRDEVGSINNGKPIVTHTYDYVTPRNAPARFLFAGISGPWLYPAFEKLEIPADLQIAVSDALIDKLAEAMLALSTGPAALPHFHVVDTRNTLSPASADDAGNSSDWLNEIHPNHQGYRKLAARLSYKISGLLQG